MSREFLHFWNIIKRKMILLETQRIPLLYCNFRHSVTETTQGHSYQQYSMTQCKSNKIKTWKVISVHFCELKNLYAIKCYKLPERVGQARKKPTLNINLFCGGRKNAVKILSLLLSLELPKNRGTPGEYKNYEPNPGKTPRVRLM